MQTTAEKKQFRVPPQNIESEKALLGSIMIKPVTLNEIIDIVNSDSFYSEKHCLIYDTMIELFSKSEPIDLLSMSSRLKEKDMLDKVGGRSYLVEMVQMVPSAGNAKHYANIVQKKSMMRALIEAADFI